MKKECIYRSQKTVIRAPPQCSAKQLTAKHIAGVKPCNITRITAVAAYRGVSLLERLIKNRLRQQQ